MTPNPLSKPLLSLLAGLFTVAQALAGETLEFKDQSFSVEIPSTWTQVKPTPEGTLSVATNPRGSTRLIVITRTVRPPNLTRFKEGLKKSMVEEGVILQPDQDFKVGDRPFVLIYGRHPTKNLTLADYITATQGKIITFAFAINGIPTTSDPDIDAIIASVKLISDK